MSMSKRVKKEEIYSIISSCLNGESISSTSSVMNTRGWDSLAQIEIFTALESLTEGKSAEIAELYTAESIEVIVQLLSEFGILDEN